MYKGAFSPIVTLFDPQGEIDYRANGIHIDNSIKGGVSGILFLGSLGEFYNLGMAEKKKYIDFAVEKVGGRVPVLIGTAGTNIREVIELSLHARNSGADAVVITQPYYMTSDEKRAHAFYRQVAGAVDIDIILYNFPDKTGFSLPPGMIAKLADEFDHIVGIKDTVDSISHTRQVLAAVKPAHPDFAVFSGFDEYFLQNLLIGGSGVISGLNNLAPQLFCGLAAALEQGDPAALRENSKKISDLMALYTMAGSFISVIKTAVSIKIPGMCTRLREPGCDLNPEEAKQVIEYVTGITGGHQA